MLLTIIAKADNARLLKATQRLCTGVYRCSITRHSAEELHGVVRIEQGATYSVAVWDSRVVCSCADSRYRAAVCKHTIALALHAIRHPETPPQASNEPGGATAGPSGNRHLILSLMMSSRLGRFFFRLGRFVRLIVFRARHFAGNGSELSREVTSITDDLKT